MQSKLYCLLLLNLSIAVNLFSQQGKLDASFGKYGVVKLSFDQAFDYYDEAQSMAILPGKILVAGNHDNSMLFARFSENGKLDLSFGDSGAIFIDYDPYTSNYVAGLTVQPDGKILAVVKSSRFDLDSQNDWSNVYIMRFDANFEFDSTFGNATLYAPKGVVQVMTGYEVTSAGSFQLLPGGKMLVSGSVQNSFLNYSDTYVVKLNPDGSPDMGFGNNGVVVPNWNEPQHLGISHLAIQPDGKLLLSGSAAPLVGPQNYVIARLNSDGSIDTSFGENGKATGILPSGNYYVQRLFVEEDGKLLAWVNGDLIPPLSLDVIRFNTDGTIDSSFGTDGIKHIENEKLSRIARIMRNDEGSFLLAGERKDSTDNNRTGFALAKLSKNLDWVGAFGNSGVAFFHNKTTYDIMRTASLLPDGKVILAGSAAKDMMLVKYYGKDTVDAAPPQDSFVINKKGLTILPNPVYEAFSVYYSIQDNAIVSIDLFDSSGRLVYVLLDKTIRNKGLNVEHFNWPADIPKGIYFLHVTGIGFKDFQYVGTILKN